MNFSNEEQLESNFLRIEQLINGCSNFTSSKNDISSLFTIICNDLETAKEENKSLNIQYANLLGAHNFELTAKFVALEEKNQEQEQTIHKLKDEIENLNLAHLQQMFELKNVHNENLEKLENVHKDNSKSLEDELRILKQARKQAEVTQFNEVQIMQAKYALQIDDLQAKFNAYRKEAAEKLQEANDKYFRVEHSNANLRSQLKNLKEEKFILENKNHQNSKLVNHKVSNFYTNEAPENDYEAYDDMLRAERNFIENSRKEPEEVPEENRNSYNFEEYLPKNNREQNKRRDEDIIDSTLDNVFVDGQINYLPGKKIQIHSMSNIPKNPKAESENKKLTMKYQPLKTNQSYETVEKLPVNFSKALTFDQTSLHFNPSLRNQNQSLNASKFNFQPKPFTNNPARGTPFRNNAVFKGSSSKNKGFTAGKNVPALKMCSNAAPRENNESEKAAKPKKRKLYNPDDMSYLSEIVNQFNDS